MNLITIFIFWITSLATTAWTCLREDGDETKPRNGDEPKQEAAENSGSQGESQRTVVFCSLMRGCIDQRNQPSQPSPPLPSFHAARPLESRLEGTRASTCATLPENPSCPSAPSRCVNYGYTVKRCDSSTSRMPSDQKRAICRATECRVRLDCDALRYRGLM